ncbi:Flp pilus assembly protein CpaB [Agromyces sp. NPDC058104]|uniref:Flp pilus assembly protein CpaB n=1 Tax=Agromyces sp. NPDC058104 TaxID=3346342 RepID=UPI0036DBE955
MKTRIIGAIVALILAIVGAFALVIYVRGADVRAAQGAELQNVYVVQETIPKGTAGEVVGDFAKLDTVPARNLVEGAVTDLSVLDGLVADADLLPGEQLAEARFIDPLELAARGEVPVPDGMQEVTITVPADRMVGGAVQPGSTVGVVYTTSTESEFANEDKAITQFIFHRMLVTRIVAGADVAVNDDEDESNSPQMVNTFLVTIAATTPQVEKLVYGAEQQLDGNGGIWLTLEPETADQGGSTPRSGENIFG